MKPGVHPSPYGMDNTFLSPPTRGHFNWDTPFFTSHNFTSDPERGASPHQVVGRRDEINPGYEGSKALALYAMKPKGTHQYAKLRLDSVPALTQEKLG